MRIPPISDEELEKTVEAYRRLGTQTAVAAELGIGQGQVSRRLRQAAQRGLLLDLPPAMPGYAIKSVAVKVGGRWVQQVRAPSEEPFELPDGQIVKGVSALVDPDGRVIQQWIKTKTDDEMPRLIAALKDVFEHYRGKSEFIEEPRHTAADLCSVYPIADQHLGLLAWGKETGDNYNLSIGMRRLRECSSRLLKQAPASKEAIILVLGDWQHTNDQKNMTPGHGNILDVDSRYQKIALAGVLLMKDIVDLALQKHKRVLFRAIPGNHDPESSFALTIAMMAFYANNPRVKVDASPGEYFWHRFGNTLIGAHHGHRMKPVDMALKLASECREDWGRTLYRWFLFGHIHHETVKEVGAVRVESFQTLASNDAHHHHSGYSSGRSLCSITLHREDGEIGRHRVNVPPPQRGGPDGEKREKEKEDRNP